MAGTAAGGVGVARTDTRAWRRPASRASRARPRPRSAAARVAGSRWPARAEAVQDDRQVPAPDARPGRVGILREHGQHELDERDVGGLAHPRLTGDLPEGCTLAAISPTIGRRNPEEYRIRVGADRDPEKR